MFTQNPRQLEHIDLSLPIKNGLQFGIGIDQALVFGVLQIVGLDVIPQQFGGFAATLVARANNGF